MQTSPASVTKKVSKTTHFSERFFVYGGEIITLSFTCLCPTYIKFHYPILQKHHWLTPVYEVRRWIKLIFTSDAKRSLRTLKTNAEISEEEISSTADLLKNLGL